MITAMVKIIKVFKSNYYTLNSLLIHLIEESYDYQRKFLYKYFKIIVNIKYVEKYLRRGNTRLIIL